MSRLNDYRGHAVHKINFDVQDESPVLSMLLALGSIAFVVHYAAIYFGF